MSISGRRSCRIIAGPKKPKVVSKIRRTKLQAYTADWDAISALVKKRAGYKCQKCGTTEGPFEADHIIPVAKGGLTVLFNLACLCWKCHSKRAGHKHLFKKRIMKRTGGKTARKY